MLWTHLYHWQIAINGSFNFGHTVVICIRYMPISKWWVRDVDIDLITAYSVKLPACLNSYILPVCSHYLNIEVNDHKPSHCKCPASGMGLWRQGCLLHRYKWASFGSASTAVTLVHSEKRMQKAAILERVRPVYLYLRVDTNYNVCT